MSEYLAIQAFGPALSHTINAFWPLRIGQIFRLLLISFFIGAWITGPVPQDFTFADIPYVSQFSIGDSMSGQIGLIISVMAGILFILLLYALFSSIFQFIFVDYLSAGDRILPSFLARTGMGIRLLGFYLATILLIGLCAVAAIIGIAIPVLLSNPDNPTIFFIALLYTLAGLLVLILPVWILTIITTDFVVPVMMVHNCGVLRGWKIIFKEFSGKWDEAGMYLLIKIGINIITGVVLGLFLVLAMESLGISSLTLIPGMPAAPDYSLVYLILPLILVAGITLIVMTPVVTFLRYYALIFLELLSDTYALLPEIHRNQR